jgi:hypothetical protein
VLLVQEHQDKVTLAVQMERETLILQVAVAVLAQ